MKKILDLFCENIDLKYKDFMSKLIPNIDIENIIGVRIPVIRKIARGMSIDEKESFIKILPHKYFEEYILHSIIVSELKDMDKCIYELERFLPYVDNWSVCDTLSCKILSSNLDKTFIFLKKCLKSKYSYQVRFAFVTMLRYFINDTYVEKCNNIAINYLSSDYYINMSIAWYFSYALINEYDKTIYIFENRVLSKWIHNKSIQKAIESYRIGQKRKDYLKSLKIK